MTETNTTEGVKLNLHARHIEIQKILKEFCENPANFVDGPASLYEISAKAKVGYAQCSKQIQLMDAYRFNPNKQPHEKFSDKVKVYKKGNGIFVWRSP